MNLICKQVGHLFDAICGDRRMCTRCTHVEGSEPEAIHRTPELALQEVTRPPHPKDFR